VRLLLNGQGRKVYFLRRIQRDPMYGDSQLSDAATQGKRRYSSEANDAQESDDVYGVYTTSKGIGLNGIACRDW
jgi:general secretion pathway protein G